uniref:Sde2_N_Ubi domain-containing protein n=1 Tax=Glossina pallidipes TaxID=7398 RepID=A0A240SX78_GLOPL
MVQIYLNHKKICESTSENVRELVRTVAKEINNLDFYLEQNGKRLKDQVGHELPVYCRLRLVGGKGGFGSMLRAIGAQIEKTTNREACRDLSGRRLRDINEEKRLKTWLEKQSEREREAEEKKKRKIQKLLAVPKHEFKDEEYEEARSKLTEKVNEAVEEGFKRSLTSGQDLKRKNGPAARNNVAAKKKRSALWMDEEFSSGSDESDSAGETNSPKFEDGRPCSSKDCTLSKLENSNNKKLTSTSVDI